MLKVDKKVMFQEYYSGVFMISLAESYFRKSSSLYINNSDGVLLLVKLQTFTVNDSERELMTESVSSFRLW